MRPRHLLFAALAWAAAAGAEEAQAVIAEAPLPPPWHYSSFGPLLSFELGSGVPGDHIAGDVGFQSFGVRNFDRVWLGFWDAAVAIRLGGLANEHPYFFFGGGTGRVSGELGRRFTPDPRWSPYLSLRGDGDLTIMATPAAPLTALNTLNNSDGFGGVIADALARLSFGGSYLAHRRSFLVTVFLQEAVRAPRVVAPGMAFTEGGIAARYDVADSFTLWVEGVLGTTPAFVDAALKTTERTVHMAVQGNLRKTFRNGVWFGFFLSYGRDAHQLSYEGGLSYGSAQPPTLLVLAQLGLPIGGGQP